MPPPQISPSADAPAMRSPDRGAIASEPCSICCAATSPAVKMTNAVAASRALIASDARDADAVTETSEHASAARHLAVRCGTSRTHGIVVQRYEPARRYEPAWRDRARAKHWWLPPPATYGRLLRSKGGGALHGQRAVGGTAVRFCRSRDAHDLLLLLLLLSMVLCAHPPEAKTLMATSTHELTVWCVHSD